MLLKGGCGYEDLRLRSPIALHHRLRSPVRPHQRHPAPGSQDNYPPYDIVRTGEDSFRISLAVAGFSPDEIAIIAQQNMLTVSGRKADQKAEARRRQSTCIRASRPGRSSASSTSQTMSRWSGLVRERSAADRAGPEDPGGDETAPDRDRNRQPAPEGRQDEDGRSSAGGLVTPHADIRKAGRGGSASISPRATS